MDQDSGREARVWVTGVGGFVGDAALRRLEQDGHPILALGHHADRHQPGPSTIVMPGPISQDAVAAAVKRHGPPALVVHAAGGSHVGQADKEPGLDFQRTVQTTGELVHGLGQAGCTGTHLIYPSSAAIYGQQPPGPINPDTSPAPISQYGWHKLLAEMVCRQGAQRYGLRVSLVRFFSLYGPGLRKQLFWELGRRLLREEGSSLELAGTGAETRDFLFIDDAIDLMLRLHADPPAEVRIANGGSGLAVSVADAVAALQRVLGTQAIVLFNGVVRAHDPQHFCADMRGLGWQAATPLADGLSDYVRWLREIGDREGPA